MITQLYFSSRPVVLLDYFETIRFTENDKKKNNELSQEAPGSETWNKHGLSDDIYEKIIAACNAVWMNVASCYLMYGES